MKIAILGAGFTGLTAGYELLKQGHEVTIFEKDSDVGGLAVGFQKKNWNWTLEKAYHHWFTNDSSVLNLAKEINVNVITKRPKTNVFVNGEIFVLDSPQSVIKFPHLPLLDRLRFGAVIAYLKLTNNHQQFRETKALAWLRKTMGEKATNLIWEPLFQGKFSDYKEEISLTWFWARIKKRTPSLAYPEGGFKTFADKLSFEIKRQGGEIFLNTQVTQIKNFKSYVQIKTDIKTAKFDKVIVTLPSPVFTKITEDLPEKYTKTINSIPHLHALSLILVLKKPFFKDTYWLNITDNNFPFLVLAEHTNFMDSKDYGGEHILYIGNYLPQDHKFLKMTEKQLLKVYDPFLKKLNKTYRLSLISSHLFLGPFAQPVVTTDYHKKIPQFKTPLKNVYLANMDMVYPWDRGTNYAVEMGKELAKLVTKI